MSKRLTRWEGVGQDGLPRAVLAKRDGSWIHNMDEAMRKLARFEDEENRRDVEDVVPYDETEARDDRPGR